MSSSPNDQNLSNIDAKGGKIKEFEPTEEQREEVKRLKGLGVPLRQIRTRIINPHTNKPVTVDTLIKYFNDERDAGECDANAAVLGVLFEECMNGNIKAISIWLNTIILPRLKAEDADYQASDEASARVVNAVSDMIKNITAQKELEHDH